MKSDIEIARSIELVKIKQIARDYDIPVEEISNYGRYIAKMCIRDRSSRRQRLLSVPE